MNNVYLIYGNNYSLIKREIDKIKEDTLDVVKYDLSNTKVDELLDDASCISLFSGKKVLIGENALFLTSSDTTTDHDLTYLEKYLKDNNHENVTIFYVLKEKLDDRKKIVKLFKDRAKVISFEDIDDKNLYKFVLDEFKKEGFKLDIKTANYFVSYVGKNIDIIISEINKMKIYKDNDKLITIDDINSISSKGFNDNVFDLTDAIMKKDFDKIFGVYNDLITIGEDEIKILSLISNQFILVYQCKLLDESNCDQKAIANLLNVHPYRVKLALETDYMTYELKNIIKKLHDLDFKIKSGNIDKKVGLKNFFINL